MLAMGGSAAGPGVGMPLEMTDEAPAGAVAEVAEQRDQGPGVPAAEGAGAAGDEDAVAWAKRWASHLVRHFR